MPTRLSLLIALLTTLITAGESLYAQELGRLFLTPAERAYLERLRLIDNQPELAVAEETESEQRAIPPADQEDIIFNHGGTMRRSDGSYTVWLNNTALDQAQLPDNVVLLTPYANGQLRISDPNSNRSYRVKPGQVLNLTTGTLQESYLAPDPAVPEALVGEASDDEAAGDEPAGGNGAAVNSQSQGAPQ